MKRPTEPINPHSPALRNRSTIMKGTATFNGLFSLLPSRGFNVLGAPQNISAFRKPLLPSTITHAPVKLTRYESDLVATNRLPLAPIQHADLSSGQHHGSDQAVTSMMSEIRSGNPKERKQALKRVATYALSVGASISEASANAFNKTKESLLLH